jgi:hypothetical protein
MPKKSGFRKIEGQRLADLVAVAPLSLRIWTRYFNRDSATLRSEIRINGMFIKVIGIAPPKFDGDLTGVPLDIWLPAMMFGPMGYGCTDGTYECSLFDAMIGRVKTRESATQVQAEANSLMIWSATNWPERPSRRQITVTSANRESPDDQADDAVQLHLLMSVTYLIRLRPELLKYSPQQIETLLKAVDQRLSLTPGVKSVAFMEGGEGPVWFWRSGRDVHVSVSGQTTAEDAVPTVLKQGVSGPGEQLPKTPFT